MKSNDDLRQDAVLSAIFKVLNELLLKNLETRKRHTSIRTYRVIPLSSRTGLLEWVDNTLPIGEYLLSAHPRIHKADLLPIDCRKRMNTEHSRKGSTPESKLKVFNEITSRIRPVFQVRGKKL